MAVELRNYFQSDFRKINRLYEVEPEPPSPVYSNKIPKHSSVSRSRSKSSKGKNAKHAKKSKTSNDDANIDDMISYLQNRVRMLEEKMQDIEKEEMRQDNSAPMTVEEKNQLGNDINNLGTDQLQHIISKIIVDKQYLEQQDGEIEINLAILPNTILRDLQKYVNQCKNGEAPSAYPSYDVDNSERVDNADSYYGYNSDTGAFFNYFEIGINV